MRTEILQIIKSRLFALDANYKAYLSAVLILLVAMIFSFTQLARTTTLFFLTSYVLFGYGFSISVLPIFIKSWANKYCQWFLGIFHLVILVASAALARELVSFALGLPPQDFELTVSLLTLILYIPVLTTFTAILSITFSLLLLLAWLIVAATHNLFVDYVLNILSKTFNDYSFCRHLSSESRGQFAWKGFFHAIGAVVIGSILCVPITFYTNYQEKLHPFVRYTAFFCDFKPAFKYPGILANERIRLHENGVISSATMTDKGVEISIKMFEDKIPNQKAGAVKPHSP